MAKEQRVRKHKQTDEIILSNAKFKSFFVLLSALKVKINLPDAVDKKR